MGLFTIYFLSIIGPVPPRYLLQVIPYPSIFAYISVPFQSSCSKFCISYLFHFSLVTLSSTSVSIPFQSGCSKVYISTSDVQMHSNYHRKDSAIIQLGFQRFRATEDCNITGCPFYGQRTTHFHCRKPGCNFSFKNKADIGKRIR